MPLYDISAHARQSQASPSVSIERGSYRLRAPATRYPASIGHESRPSRDSFPTALRYEKQMALLVILLVCATVTCFATAYYLFTTRWDTPTHSTTSPLPSDTYSQPQVAVDFNLDAFSLSLSGKHVRDDALASCCSEEERFLAYLPHSGFHNQRIAFENALVLSRLLNRTLLVPPVRLGKPLFYAPYRTLQEMLVNSSKAEVQYCRQYRYLQHQPDLIPAECVDYFQYTDVPWDWLVDLSDIKAQQKVVQRWDFADDWLYHILSLEDKDIFMLLDSDRDSYGFQDFISLSGNNARKFQHMVHLSTLAHRTERLIHLGTLFGTSRLHLRTAVNLNLRKHVRTQMTQLRPFLGDVAIAVEYKLRQDYLGAHVRVGDGSFEEDAADNVRVIWWKLMHGVLGYDMEETLSIERSLVSADASQPPDMPLDWAPENFNLTSNFSRSEESLKIPLESCRGTLHAHPRFARLNKLLYISTDSPDPYTDVHLKPFLQTFPCTLFLSDFATETAPLSSLYNPHDGVRLNHFLAPLLDAMIVARAVKVVGTEGSTFSRFVEDVLWRVHHGLDVVSKG